MNKPVILLVDDVLSNIDVLKSILVDNYQMKVALSGEVAIKAARTQPQPDLILLDILMPEMDGFEVCRQLKEDESTKDIPIIFLSILDNTSARLKCFEVGGVDYVSKPFQKQELLARVATHLKLSNLQKELVTSNRQLTRNITELVDTQHKLIESQKHESLSQLSVGISHKVNTPLGNCVTTISSMESDNNKLMEKILNNQLAKAELINYAENSKVAFELIQRNIQQVVDLFQKLRDATGFELQQPDQLFNLDQIVKATRSLFKDRIKEHQVNINWQSECPVPIVSNVEAWSLVIFHLIENSLIHGFKDQLGCEISLKLTQDANNYHFVYRDNGRGLSASEIKHFFDPFGESQIGLGGTTINSAVIYRIKGNAKVTSSPRKGCEICIEFPRVEKNLDALI